MDEIIVKTNKTPIEIALQIDDDGFTTAKRSEERRVGKECHSRW